MFKITVRVEEVLTNTLDKMKLPAHKTVRLARSSGNSNEFSMVIDTINPEDQRKVNDQGRIILVCNPGLIPENKQLTLDYIDGHFKFQEGNNDQG